MVEKQKQGNKKIKNILSELALDDEIKQIKAIKSLKMHGDESVIEPLVQVYINVKSENLKAEIEDLLNTIKSTKVPPEIIKCLNNAEYKTAHRLLLASIWNSGLDYRPYLGDIASATVDGDFMSAMECITILENLEGALDETEIMDALLIFKNYLVDNKEEEGPKVELIKEMVITLQQLNDNV